MWGDSAAKHPSQFAEKMVRIEIEASENAGRRDVGEPITIVRLTVETGFILESSGFAEKIDSKPISFLNSLNFS